MQQYNESVQEEISLREIIEVFFKRKKLIAIITAITLLIGSLGTFVVLSEKYESKVVLLASPTTIESSTLDGIDNIVEFFNKLPAMTIEAYMEQIKSPRILQNTIVDLDLRNDDGEYITRGSLSNKITVSNTENTNLIAITVEDTDPELATNIANTISKYFIQFITENNQRQSQQAANLIQEQLLIEEQNLSDKSEELANYLANSRSIDELKAEVNALVSQISSYKSSLLSLGTQIQSDSETLQSYADQGFTVINPPSMTMNINVESGEKEVQVPLSSGTQLQDSLLAMEITELETRLLKNLSQKQAIEAQMEEMKLDLVAAQSLLAQEEYKYNAITRELELAKQTYNAYQERHKEAVIAAASEIGSSSIIVSSEAVVPVVPISPNKTMNLTISFVLGLMLGVFVAFFKEYWSKSETQKN